MRNTFAFKAGIAGVLAGFLSGMLGVGGGFALVPIFVLWIGIDQKRAHATSLAAIMPIAAFSATGYAIRGDVNWQAWALVMLGSVVGASYGVKLLHHIPVKELKYLFAGVLTLSALRLLWSTQPNQLFEGLASHVLLVLIGFIAGVAAGLLGVGGGIIIVPALIMTAGANSLIARGTSLAVVVGTSIAGSLAHHKRGNIDWLAAKYAGLAGIPASLLGTYISGKLDERIAMMFFSVVLLITAHRMFISAKDLPN